MRTAYRIVGSESMIDFELTEKKELIKSVEDAISLIIELAGNYRAALEFLDENRIATRLDYSKVEMSGMPVLSELMEVRTILKGELTELEFENRKNSTTHMQ